ncbi:MAG TPA: DNA methyltransferase [Terriglobales bacterium]
MTELIWDGKYKDGKKQGPVRIALPFQTIETVNESTQDRQRNLELFASGRDTEWRNRLIWGDKKYVLPSLLPEFAGEVNLIYIDPPFDTGADFSFRTSIPHLSQREDDGLLFTKEPSILEQKAYRDTWGRGLDSYLEWLHAGALLLYELLSEAGSLYIHIGPNVSHYVKVLLDEVFGCPVRNTIIWKRADAHNDPNKFGIIHDELLYYAKSERATWNAPVTTLVDSKLETDAHYVWDTQKALYFRLGDLKAPGGRGPRYTYKGITRNWKWTEEKLATADRNNELYFTKNRVPFYRLYIENPEMPVQDIWADVPQVKSGVEVVGYPTQKPEALLERIINASSIEGDLVLDCFVGGGTTAAVAEKLNRRWIGCDLSRFAIHTTRKRLLGIANVKPFAVQNLGKYERQAWQAAEFPANGKDHLEEQREREAAYRKFILDLYHATPMTGRSWLHGTKSGRMVHVAAVDAPVTQADVKSIAREAWKSIASGKDAPTKAAVDILGWEFALEVNESAKNVAAESRVDVSFKKIPREVLDKKAVEQGDVKFFELGALAVDVKQKGHDLALKLSDFVIPTDDIPEEARKAIKHWSQLVDYWAVDWDYKNDTFHNQWQAYRTRKEPKIELETKYTYTTPGKYAVVVKVIDILGNDTTKTLEVTVK